MADSEITRDHPSASSEEGGQAAMALQSEVDFWQDMIVTCKETLPPEAIERMQFARALAERRLQHCREAREMSINNVFSLDQARRKPQ